MLLLGSGIIACIFYLILLKTGIFTLPPVNFNAYLGLEIRKNKKDAV